MFSEKEMDKYVKALSFSSYKHRFQKRKSEKGIPYINHPIRVSEILWENGIRDIDVIVAGVLHDTVEDTETTVEEIREIFGNDVALYISEVSDDKTLPKEERKRLQVEHAKNASNGAKLVKLADKIANVHDIGNDPPQNWTLERRKDYLLWASKVIDQVRGTNKQLEDKFDQVLEQSKEKLDNL